MPADSPTATTEPLTVEDATKILQELKRRVALSRSRYESRYLEISETLEGVKTCIELYESLIQQESYCKVLLKELPEDSADVSAQKANMLHECVESLRRQKDCLASSPPSDRTRCEGDFDSMKARDATIKKVEAWLDSFDSRRKEHERLSLSIQRPDSNDEGTSPRRDTSTSFNQEGTDTYSDKTRLLWKTILCTVGRDVEINFALGSMSCRDVDGHLTEEEISSIEQLGKKVDIIESYCFADSNEGVSSSIGVHQGPPHGAQV